MSLKTYNNEEVSVILGGRVMTGMAETDAITISRENDSWVDRAGMRGGVTRSKSSDKRGSIVIRLEQTSTDNDYLSEKADLDEKSAAGIISVLIRDAQGTTLCSAPEAWVMKPADVSFAKESGEREWTIRCADLSTFVGSN